MAPFFVLGSAYAMEKPKSKMAMPGGIAEVFARHVQFALAGGGVNAQVPMQQRLEKVLDECGGNDTQALFRAVLLGDTEIIGLLIERGAKLNALHTETKLTPLHFAVRTGSVKAIDVLCKHGASVGIHFNGKMPLNRALELGNGEVAERLLLALFLEKSNPPEKKKKDLENSKKRIFTWLHVCRKRGICNDIKNLVLPYLNEDIYKLKMLKHIFLYVQNREQVRNLVRGCHREWFEHVFEEPMFTKEKPVISEDIKKGTIKEMKAYTQEVGNKLCKYDGDRTYYDRVNSLQLKNLNEEKTERILQLLDPNDTMLARKALIDSYFEKRF